MASSSSSRDERDEEVIEQGRSDRDEEESTETEEEVSGDGEGFVVRCLKALDVQVIGACRADERLTPLLKLNASAGIGRGPDEDRLISQLIQHFEVSEIGLLARCLCAPLVSIRVGKIIQQGSLLCPTTSRGHLNVNILPSSWFQISYVGDDGHTFPLPPIRTQFIDDIIIEEISSDRSGRSFVLRFSASCEFYYWLSEKSLSYGIQLLEKLKDILKTKPSLSDLTGISNSRLDSFGTHLQSYFLRSQSITSPQVEEPPVQKPGSRFRNSKNQNLRSRSNVSFKDGASSSSTFRKRRNDLNNNNNNLGSLSIPSLPININIVPVSSPLPLPTIPFNKSQEDTSSSPFALPPDILPQFSPFNPLTFTFPLPPVHSEKPIFKPYYCWCPMGQSSPVQSRPLPLQSMPLTPFTSPFSPVPPPITSINSVPPLPIGSQIQFPSFSGMMSDPIVHIPIMDIRLSGQAYLVSAGPMISTAVPPLLVPATESLVEKNARETLRCLLESAPSNLIPDPVHGGVTFGIDQVMSGISSMGLCSSFQGECGDDEDNRNGLDEGEE